MFSYEKQALTKYQPICGDWDVGGKKWSAQEETKQRLIRSEKRPGSKTEKQGRKSKQ